MPSNNPETRATVARIAAAARWGDKSQSVVETQRNLRAAALEQYIAKAIAAAPPLTPEQRDKLAALLSSDSAVPSHD